MAYVIDRFGATYGAGVVLPTLDGRQPQGAGAVDSSQVKLPGGGAFDWRGASDALPEVETVRVRGVWKAADPTAMETKLAALKALCGQRSYLWQSNGSAQRSRLARCLEVSSDLEAGFAADALIEMVFELAATPWAGTARNVSQSLDASPKSYTLTNGGNARVRDVVITVVAATSNITQIYVVRSGLVELRWQGTITPGSSLVIDTGARSVKLNGADAYAGLSLQGGHIIADWLRLDPGDNTVLISRTGGGTTSTGAFVYADGHR